MFKKNKKQQYIGTQETFRVMANQLRKYQEQGNQCIAFTSHQKEQGKSYVIHEVATTLARGGSKVLILDANVFTSTLTYLYERRSEVGLLELLEEMKQHEGGYPLMSQILEQYTYETKEENLYCLPKGGDGQEVIYEQLIKEAYLKHILAELRVAFNYILIEVPSFECLSYTQIMTAATDGCILVLKSGELEISDTLAVREQIDSLGCEVLSCVLNQKEEILYKLPKEKKQKKSKKSAKKKAKKGTPITNEGVTI